MLLAFVSTCPAWTSDMKLSEHTQSTVHTFTTSLKPTCHRVGTVKAARSRRKAMLSQRSALVRILSFVLVRYPETDKILGPRACIGRKFATLEATAFLTLMLRDWKVEPKMAAGQTIEDWKERVLNARQMATLAIYDVPARFTRRHTALSTSP